MTAQEVSLQRLVEAQGIALKRHGAELLGLCPFRDDHDATFPWFEDSAVTIGFEMPRRKKDNSSFGPRLTAIPKARGLTQIQLAAAAGTTQRSISCYENDDGVPPASAIIALSKALK